MIGAEDFYRQHQERWGELETLVARLADSRHALSFSGLRRLDELYWQAGRDLAAVETRYPESRLPDYLRHLLARAHTVLHGHAQRRSAVAWGSALFRGFPRAVWRLADAVRLSALVFVLGMALGAVLILVSDESASLLLSPGMIESVQAGKMWTEGLLNVVPSSILSAGIAANNITVTFAAFAFGIVFGVGSLYVMLMNGLLFGAAMTYCIHWGIGFAFFSFVSGHGYVELSVIILSGGAGWALGSAMLAPGRLPRAVAVKNAAKDGATVLLAAIPLLLFAGTLEGYLSPAEHLPGEAKMVIGFCLGVIFWAWLYSQRGVREMDTSQHGGTKPFPD